MPTNEDIEHIHKRSPAHTHLRLRDSPLGKVFLISDIQVSITSYVLQISPVVSNQSIVVEIRFTSYSLY